MSDLSFRQQLAITIIDKLVIAGILVVIGLWANANLELIKSKEQVRVDVDKAERQQKADQTKGQLDLIQRQLNELYYPVYFRLAKDDATWEEILSKLGPGQGVEDAVVLPNNKEVLALLENHTDLLFRPDEERQSALMNAFLQYERHMAVYLSLRAAGDKHRPADFGVDYPNQICQLVEARVNELENQISRLRASTAATGFTAGAPAKITSCVRARRVPLPRAQ